MVNKLFVFIFLVMFGVSAPALAVNYCQFGEDAFDEDFMSKYDGTTGWMPAESTVRMRGKHDVYYCKLREKQLVALHPQTSEPVAFVTCGNPILNYSVPQQQATQVQSQVSAQPRTNTLLELAKRPMGEVQVVDGTNPKARLTAEQFQFRFNAGVGWLHHSGLKGTKVLQNQSQNQSAHSSSRGGSSSTKTIVRNEGGNGGGGDDGGPNDFASPPEGGGPEDFASPTQDGGPGDFASGN